MRNKFLTTTLLALVALAAPALRAENQAGTDFHKAAEVAGVMDRLESNALDVRQQAARLRSYNRTPTLYSWELHADELNRISGEMEQIAALVQELTPIKPYMTFRQAAAFNHIVSLSARLSDATEEAIAVVNDQKARLRVGHPDYTTKVDAIYDHADLIAAHADSVEDWAEFIEELSNASDD